MDTKDLLKNLELLRTLASKMPEEEQQRIAAEMKELTDLINEIKQSEEEVEEINVEAFLPLGKELYNIAVRQMKEGEVPFEKLSEERQVYWTVLAVRIKFNPEDLQCMCKSCLKDKELEMCKKEPELPKEVKEVLEFLKSKGIDPSNVRVETITRSKKSH